MNAKTELALVSGANRGLGFESCRQLAERGVRVLLTARDGIAARAAASELAGAGLPVESKELDVTSDHSVRALTAALREREPLTILVNNAGITLDGFDESAAHRRKGASGIAWAALVSADGPTGGFFRDGARIEW